MIKIYCADDYKGMSRKAAEIVASEVTLKPDCVLGLPTGSTPVGMYQQLIEWNKAGDLDFSEVKTCNLDEYVGLDPTHDQSYRYFMQSNLFDHINIKPEHTHVPEGNAADPDAACKRYDDIIRDLGGIDLQVVGIGRNGHVGFNEPSTSFPADTHVVDLTEDTIDANSRLFASRDEVPKRAMTMGVRPIMQAKRVLMIVNGENKAAAVKAAFSGPITPEVPASILQLHPCLYIVGTKDAMAQLG